MIARCARDGQPQAAESYFKRMEAAGHKASGDSKASATSEADLKSSSALICALSWAGDALGALRVLESLQEPSMSQLR